MKRPYRNVPRQGLFSLPGLTPRPFSIEVHKRIQMRIDLLNPPKVLIHDLDRRHLPFSDQVRDPVRRLSFQTIHVDKSLQHMLDENLSVFQAPRLK